VSRRPTSTPILGTSPTLKRALDEAACVAATTAAVLIRGESGTGKELFAQYVHERSGRNGVFVAVNCAALPEAILESVLFGHKRGAFTGRSRTSPTGSTVRCWRMCSRFV
jgi:transcriptional regulator with PAS, ATPase and Fis domain